MMMADKNNLSLRKTAVKMWNDGGALGLFRGNLATILKIAPQTATQFVVRLSLCALSPAANILPNMVELKLLILPSAAMKIFRTLKAINTSRLMVLLSSIYTAGLLPPARPSWCFLQVYDKIQEKMISGLAQDPGKANTRLSTAQHAFAGGLAGAAASMVRLPFPCRFTHEED